MPLTVRVRKVLQDGIHHVPEKGLFVCSSAAANFLHACPRYDLVELLVSRARSSLVPTAAVLMHGLRRTGKTFSMPWALLEAIRRLEEQEGGAQMAVLPSSSSSAAGSECMAPRRRYVLVVPCHQVTCLDLEEIPVLLAAAAYLKIPAVFDEFTEWKQLPAALEGFLEERRGRQPHLTLLPLQFVLQDSMQANVTQVAGSHGVLYNRANLGVQGPVSMPQPSVQLLAGMLQAYHPGLYPHRLLRVVATTGRMLDSIFANPETALGDLGVDCLRQHVILQPDHLAALWLAVEGGSAESRDNAQVLQLRDAGISEASSFAARTLHLADPKLITLNALQQGFRTLPVQLGRLEQLLEGAEGKVLEVLVRKDLASSIIEKLGLTGQGQPCLWWGNLGQAELDLLMVFDSGPLVWVSCKRSQDEQKAAAFLPHIKAIENLAAGHQKGRDAKLAKLDSNAHELVRNTYALESAVIIMRCMTAGAGVRLVGIGAVAASRQGPQLSCTLDVRFEGRQHAVVCSYHGMLLEELVQPVPADVVYIASPLSRAPLE